ncbi:MAG: ribosomal protein S18-alanine N-acetyltransferase [Candidatus Nezhaarchaeota archaeon]|nr:ribosomal protein S18-alanine N-acetyltransferase [Candidatus Nezhaarchaeota archaeon]
MPSLARAFSLRLFEPRDLSSVLYINGTCLPENYSPDFFLMHRREYPEAFLVAELEGEVVAYSMSRVEYGLSNLRRTFVKKGHVISIAVLPHARRMGIGSALMARTMDALRRYGASEVFLEVRVSNEPAIALYRKLGFEYVRKIRGYYADGEDAWIMARPL